MVTVRKRLYMALAAFAVVLGGVLMLSVFGGTSQAALPRDCDNNAIIKCGAVDVNELKNKYNSQADLKNIYAHYGVSAGMLDGAQMGEVHKDGRVTVGGRTVATGASSIGRQNIFSGSTKINIAGNEYYETPNSSAFRSQSITAFVFLDGNGEFVAAILTSCGNPVRGVKVHVPKPSYKCVSLTGDKINRNTYKFTATATAENGATIVGYRYDFGDGKSETSQSNIINHTYAQPGEYVAKVVVDVKVGDQIKQVTDNKCQVKVPVKSEAAYACESLTARVIKKEDRSYAFDLKYTTSGDATLQKVDFDFGDGQGRQGVTPDQLGSVTHAYPSSGSYTAKATLYFQTGEEGQAVKTDDCQVAIEIGQEMCPHNPSLPVGDARCAPAVPELPKTGPMDFISGGLGIGALVASAGYWYASRRGLLDAWLSR